jgi:hypothetical protein
MSYNYAEYRASVFTEEGVTMLLKIRDKTRRLLAEAGAARCDKMIAGCAGLNWNMLACVDRLVEMGEIYEIPNTKSTAGQHRLFTSFDA